MNWFEKKIFDFINTERLIGTGDVSDIKAGVGDVSDAKTGTALAGRACGRVLVAVSGGADSVALLVALCELINTGQLKAEVVAGHINHKLRGELADRDEEFVKNLCSELGVGCYTVSADVGQYAKQKGLSIETAAREVRLGELFKMANEQGCDVVATAHHKDDNAETVTQRLMRGTGYRGLAGIWPKKKFESGTVVVRPMLCVRREEIVEYLSLKGYRWMDDHTNEQLVFTRNRIRHLLLPDMQEASSSDIVEKLWEMSQLCRSLQGRVGGLVDDMWDDIVLEETGERVVFEACKVAGHSEAIGVEIINRAVEMLGCGQGKLNEFHYRSILELSECQCGGAMDLPGDYRVRRAGGELIFEQITEAEKEVGQGPGRSGGDFAKVPIEGEVCFGGWRIKTRRLTVSGDDLKDFLKGKDEFVEWLDAGKVEGDIIARRRRTGDRFVPFGSGSSKRVGKFLTANQLSPDKKKKVVIFADNHKILWVSPVRLSGLAGVDGSTREVIELRVLPG